MTKIEMTNEEAIELIYDIQTDAVYNILPDEKEALQMAIKALEQQPKTGHWIVIREKYEFMGGTVNEPRGCKCSNCNKVVRFKSDFCPNCGADMRGENNG